MRISKQWGPEIDPDRTQSFECGAATSSKRPKLDLPEELAEDLPGEPTALYEDQDKTQQLPQLVVTTICPGHLCLCELCAPTIVEDYLEQAKLPVQEEVRQEIQAKQKDTIIAEYRAAHGTEIEYQAHKEFLAEAKSKLQDEAWKAEIEEAKASILQEERAQIAQTAFEQGMLAKQQQITQMLAMQAP